MLGYSQGGAIAQQLVLDHPKRCSRLELACTYAFNMATFREKLEGHLVPLLIRVLGMRRLAQVVVSQGLKHLGRSAPTGWSGLIADQDRQVDDAPHGEPRWRSTAGAAWPRSGARRSSSPPSNDQAVPLHHAKMLHDGISGSQLVMIDHADHALIWTHPDEFVRATEEFLAE